MWRTDVICGLVWLRLLLDFKILPAVPKHVIVVQGMGMFFYSNKFELVQRERAPPDIYGERGVMQRF